MRSSRKRPTLSLLHVVCAFVLFPILFAAQGSETPFTASAIVTCVNFGTALETGTNLLVLNARASLLIGASDRRVAGAGTITFSGIWRTNHFSVLWGNLRLDNIAGTWNGYLHATNSLQHGHMVMSLAMTAEGSGVYQGLVFRATTTRLDNGPIESTGYIIKDSQEARPYQVKGLRVDRAMKVRGMLLDPLTLGPTGTCGTLVLVVLGSQGGEASYLGRAREEGLGLLDPVTGMGSMMGTSIPVDGEQCGVLRWVAQSTTGLSKLVATNTEKAVVAAEVHFAGGTARFEDATGGFSARVIGLVSSTPVPTVFNSTFQYEAAGAIRFSGSAEEGQ